MNRHVKVTCWMCLLTVLNCAAVCAEIKAKVDLKVGTSVGYAGWREHRKTRTCNVLGGSTETLGFNPVTEQVSMNGTLESGSILTSRLSVTRNGTTERPVVRTITLSEVIALESAREKINLSLSESRTKNIPEDVQDGECDKDVYYTRPYGETTTGTISISYPVPIGVWMVIVKYEQIDGVFESTEDKTLAGALINGVREGVTASSAYVFVQPGELLTKTFTFDEKQNGVTEAGTAAISFEPIKFPFRGIDIDELPKRITATMGDRHPAQDGR